MNVAIIGSTSFLAQYIIRELIANNLSPQLYGRKPSSEFERLHFNLFYFPNQHLNLSEFLKFDIIIYTAGAGVQADKNEISGLIYELNTFIPIRLLNFLSDNNYKGKILTFGSYFEIGYEPNKRFYTEEDIVTSQNCVINHYAVSKRLLSRFLFSKLQTVNFYHLILPNIYGKGENAQRLIPYIINALKNNDETKLTSGLQVRQYIHAVDVAKTVVDIMRENYPRGIYNLCQREVVQIKDLVAKIFEIWGDKEKFGELSSLGTKGRGDSAMPFLLMDNSKAVNTFGYQPAITIEEGVKTYLI